MSPSHTVSAPWTRKRLDANHVMIHDADGMTIVPRMISEPGTASEAAGMLIAAAPDLLAVLRKLIDWQAVPLGYLEDATAAITKAEWATIMILSRQEPMSDELKAAYARHSALDIELADVLSQIAALKKRADSLRVQVNDADRERTRLAIQEGRL